ncbi:hypothetical protein E2C01_025156 [Portunus trituberculatus]|uniref:Uncharacterized protein n=1 Tax=Portunus trituberculatus TaxID=210409 RepID=A0A5B7EF81_PORTR|nr:hypothetical protein [Portunus trituberculatus]
MGREGFDVIVHGKGTLEVIGGENSEGHPIKPNALVVPHDPAGLALGPVSLLQAARVAVKLG